VKKSSITWHYRGADPEWGLFQCRQCQDLLENNLANKRPIEVLVGKKNLEVRPIAVNKGEIVKRILFKNPDAEFVFCAGDDKVRLSFYR
jgi:trehalose 6-phosphate synthase/phosphatase